MKNQSSAVGAASPVGVQALAWAGGDTLKRERQRCRAAGAGFYLGIYSAKLPRHWRSDAERLIQSEHFNHGGKNQNHEN